MRLPQLAIVLINALIDDRQGPLLERLLRERRLPKKQALDDLANSRHSHVVLGRLKNAGIVWEDGEDVVLCHPTAIAHVLEMLDDYVEAVAGELASEARDRKRDRRAAASDPVAFLAEMRTRPVSLPEPLDPWRIDGWSEPPFVIWVSWVDGSRGRYELQNQAARYNEEFHRLTINADWRALLLLCDAVERSIGDPLVLSRQEVLAIVHDEWARCLSSIVVERATMAAEDGTADCIGEFLSEVALTTAMASCNLILARCTLRISKLASRRKSAARRVK